MRKTSLRILKALHEGHILRRYVDRCQEDPDVFHVLTCQVTEAGGETFLEGVDPVAEYRRSFSETPVDDLRMAEFLEWIPETGTNALFALTPKGLQAAQALYGPIAAKVMVKHEEGVEIVPPTGDGSDALPTGDITIHDFPDDADLPSP